MDPTDNTWQRYAVCADPDIDPDLFFPERGKNATKAKAICTTCPARQACLDAAMAEEADIGWRYGIRGGLSANERARLAGKRVVRPRPIVHGSPGGANAHYERGEKPCDICRVAWAEYRRTRRAQLTVVA